MKQRKLKFKRIDFVLPVIAFNVLVQYKILLSRQ